jgi:C-terminal processing protease CtpA/Prc
MDKSGVVPDVAVEVSAEDWARGTDPQLAKAVEVLQADVVVWKKVNGVETVTTTPSNPTTNPTAPMPEPAQPSSGGGQAAPGKNR